jgi:hypothetical protein
MTIKVEDKEKRLKVLINIDNRTTTITRTTITATCRTIWLKMMTTRTPVLTTKVRFIKQTEKCASIRK